MALDLRKRRRARRQTRAGQDATGAQVHSGAPVPPAESAEGSDGVPPESVPPQQLQEADQEPIEAPADDWHPGTEEVPRWFYDRVGAALEGDNPTVLTRLEGGFVAIGDVQFLPGYCVFFTDEPATTRLTDLTRKGRLQFLADAERVGEAVERVCARRDPSFRTINIEVQGNENGFLHAHVWPRYGWEPPDVANRPVGRYPDERWADPETRLGPQHDDLREELLAELNLLVYDPARTPPRSARRRRLADPLAVGELMDDAGITGRREEWTSSLPPEPNGN